MKLASDPRPWIAADGTSSGPLNSYLITVCLWMGLKPGFVLVHILANLLVSLQIIVAYLTLRRLKSHKAAALGALLIAIFYGVAVDTDYLQYASELLPSLLLMLGFYFLICWLDDSTSHRSEVQLAQLFGCGLMLGAAPWCKLQAAPISGSLCLVAVASVLSARDRTLSFSARTKELAAFCAGAALTTCMMAVVLIKTHAIGEFWSSYIQGNLSQAGPLSLQSLIIHLCVVFLLTPIHQFILVGILGLLLYEVCAINKPLVLHNNKWIVASLWIYIGAGLIAVCRAKYFFPHYTIFVVAPTAYLATLSACAGISQCPVRIGWPRKAGSWLALALLGVILCVYTAYAVRYVRMAEFFRLLTVHPGDSQSKLSFTDTDSGLRHMLSMLHRATFSDQ